MKSDYRYALIQFYATAPYACSYLAGRSARPQVAYPCAIATGTRAHQVCQATAIMERHRHRFEFNNKYKALFEKNGMLASGICKERDLVEIVELPDHPWFVGVQFHPEFKSKPLAPHPLFVNFVKASLHRK